MQVNEIREQLELLHLERLEAETAGLTRCEAYMRDLEQEISECRVALITATATEIATARGVLWGRLQG
jgi:hypothetical protein